MGPYALPCDPEAARVLTKGKEGPKTRKGLSFAKQKFFEPCPQRQVQCEHCGAKGGRKGNPEPGELSAKALLEQATVRMPRTGNGGVETMGAVWGIADQEGFGNGAGSLDDMEKQGGLHMINRLRADAGQRQMRRASLGTIAWSQEGILVPSSASIKRFAQWRQRTRCPSKSKISAS